MSLRRVVVTGTGVVSAIGMDTQSFWESLRECRPGIGPYRSVDSAQVRFKNGAEIQGYDPAAYFHNRETDLMDRFAQFAVIAAREAMGMSGLTLGEEEKTRTAVICGTSIGGVVAQAVSYTHLTLPTKA